ncbi:hypothetical protein FE257_004319 [Aspergillus nanangensis]|uniref:Uncharacterized protein n=1 Tax=Aspergillus nanangensis TaxID=2582783 RepID=A0AAD4CAT8_ASPNN|nr:hypothetical protein FE257_004319 [Aspergillus nanangensis]
MSPTESASTPQVLRIPRSDDPGSFALLHVVRSGKDFDIVATEGENPYATKVRQTDLRHLRAKNYQGSDDEWHQIVSHVFDGQVDSSAEKPDVLAGVESSASIVGQNDSDRELVITIRKRIQAITQRLGSVSLRQDDEQAIQLFEWTGMAVSKAESMKGQFASLLCRYRDAEDTISRLNKQLEEFIRAKNQHEEQLMADFAQLLNEKKLKIRNQQRLLASASLDEEKLSDIQTATFGRHRTPSSKGQNTKRSARRMDGRDSESEDGFEQMELDRPDDRQNSEKHKEINEKEQSTPQPFEEEGNNTTDSDSDSSVQSPRKESSNDSQINSSREPVRRPATKESTPPPRRELPFTRKTDVKRHVAETRPHRQNEAAEDSTGETDDDEL